MSASFAPLTPWRLCRLLVALRLRLWWGGVRKGPRVAVRRLAFGVALLASVSYVGLFLSALATIGETAGFAAQTAALGVVTSALVLASFAAKVASGEAALATPEDEFLRCRPVSLSSLVVARSLAGVVTDVFDALFLCPILIAAVVLFDLGALGVLGAVITSAIVQVAVTAAAQGVQISLVRVVGGRGRGLLWVILSLLSALSMASLWMAGSWVLRKPAEAASALVALEGGRWSSLLQAVSAPVVNLAHAPQQALLSGLGLFASAAALMAASALVAVWASRKGWEPAGPAWHEARRYVDGPRAGVSVFGKDLRLILRDRARLAMLVALPLLFVGLQVFGSAGWTWSTASPRSIALLAYSLCAYAATLGPLRHMEFERGAFWLLLTAPRPLGRLMAHKALLWSLLLGGACAFVIVALGVAARLPVSASLLSLAATAVVGAALLAWLAVGVACGSVDLSDETRGGLGIGTVYLFLVAAGVFNLALSASGVYAVKGVLLFVGVTALCWTSGIARARNGFDPVSPELEATSPAAGLAVVLLYAASRVDPAAQSAGLLSTQATGLACVGYSLIGIGTLCALARRWVRFALVAVAAVATCVLLVSADAVALPVSAAFAQELVLRGLVQRGLGRTEKTRALLAVACSAALGLLVIEAPNLGLKVAFAVVPALVYAATSRVSAALGVRLLLVLATAWLG